MLTRKNEDVAPLHHLQTRFDCVLPSKIGIWVSKVEMSTLKRHKSGICHGQNYVLNADIHGAQKFHHSTMDNSKTCACQPLQLWWVKLAGYLAVFGGVYSTHLSCLSLRIQDLTSQTSVHQIILFPLVRSLDNSLLYLICSLWLHRVSCHD